MCFNYEFSACIAEPNFQLPITNCELSIVNYSSTPDENRTHISPLGGARSIH